MSAAIDSFTAGYDEAGNPQYVRAAHLGDETVNESWRLTTDALNRLALAVRGRLDTAADPQILPDADPETHVWGLDQLGNWTAFDVYCGMPADPPPLRAGDGTCPDEEEDARDHNTVNELTIWSASDPVSRTTYLSDLVYDRAGSLLANPLAGDCVAVADCVGHFYKYGPWGRLHSVYELGDASVDENGTVISGALGPLVASFEYDALGRRVLARWYDGPSVLERRYVYDGLRLIEERNAQSPGQGTIRRSYIWGTQYIDQLWAVDVPTTGQRFLATHDLNHSVSSLVVYDPATTSTEVQAHYRYAPYGRRTTVTEYPEVGEQSIGYMGLHHDAPTGLIHARTRYLDPHMGRWTQRDPTGYADGMNLYLAFAANPTRFRDPMGTDTVIDDGRDLTYLT
ncbi:MAG: RHS repeat-associated core domain-containing protein [bacterium]|nr:RHS repeat-associated core domain-containing protein [bacterium]